MYSIMEWLTQQSDLLKKIITCDETRIFQHDPKTKRQFYALEESGITKNEQNSTE